MVENPPVFCFLLPRFNGRICCPGRGLKQSMQQQRRSSREAQAAIASRRGEVGKNAIAWNGLILRFDGSYSKEYKHTTKSKSASREAEKRRFSLFCFSFLLAFCIVKRENREEKQQRGTKPNYPIIYYVNQVTRKTVLKIWPHGGSGGGERFREIQARIEREIDFIGENPYKYLAAGRAEKSKFVQILGKFEKIFQKLR